jgi:hypothetical protein
MSPSALFLDRFSPTLLAAANLDFYQGRNHYFVTPLAIGPLRLR